MASVKRIDHVAVVVDDVERAMAFWQRALGVEGARVEDSPGEHARIAIFPMGNSEIELVQPTTEDSGLARYLEKHGPGMHHVCLEVDDIEGMLAQLREAGVQSISGAPLSGLGGRRYAFLHPRVANGVLVELCQRD